MVLILEGFLPWTEIIVERYAEQAKGSSVSGER
jgi:hypothetical protein